MGIKLRGRRLAKLLELENIDLCLIQETKQSQIFEAFVHSIWGKRDVEWSFKKREGSAGGMILYWKPNIF